MTLIQIDPVGTTTLACTSSTISDCVDDKGDISLTATGIATTIAISGGVNTNHIHINVAERYVDSLNDEQLAEMTNKLDELDQNYIINLRIGSEAPKVYTKKNS